LRVTQGRLYLAFEKDGLFTTDQLRTMVAAIQRGAGDGVDTAWIFQALGSLLFYLLLLRSRYLPRPIAVLGVVGAVLFLGVSVVMFVFPRFFDQLKLLGLPVFFAEV